MKITVMKMNSDNGNITKLMIITLSEHRTGSSESLTAHGDSPLDILFLDLLFRGTQRDELS